MADGGTLSVFEQGGVKYLAQFYLLDGKDLGAANEDGTVPVWKHIASVGDYDGHPSGGFKFTRKAFDQIVANFQLRATPLNIDYEHQTFNRALKGRIESAGWINQLELRDDGDELWALLNLLPDAADAVRAKQIRQCSPVIVPEGTDRQTAEDIGFELKSLALTNDPFLDGLHPFLLTRVAAMTDDEKMKYDEEMAAKKSEEDKAKKMAEDDGGGAAQSVVDRIASAGGGDSDSVLAFLEESLDKLTTAFQQWIEKGGTAAENSSNREMRAMTITVGPITEDKVADKTLKLAVDAADGKIKKLTEVVAEQAKTIKSFADARIAAETAAIEAKCKKLQEDGFIAKGDQALKDAVELFREKPAVAERIYSMQIPPAGTEAGDDPDAASGTGGKPLLMSQLDDMDKARFESLRAIGRSEKQALEFIAKKAAQRAAHN